MSKYILNNIFAKNKKDAIDIIFAQPNRYFISLRVIKEIDLYFALRIDSYFVSILNSDRFIKSFCPLKRNSLNSFIRVVFYFEQCFDEKYKKIISELLINNNKLLYTIERKKTANFLAFSSFIKDKDPLLVTIFKIFFRYFNPNQFEKLIKRIDGGIDNKEIKEIISKTKTYKYLNYSKDSIQDKNIKRELLKEISITQDILKRIDFDLNVGFEDIKELPPVLRFKFLKFAFNIEIKICRQTYLMQHLKKFKTLNQYIDNIKFNRNIHRLKIDTLTPDQISELLFSISISKNNEFNEWFKKYKVFYNAKMEI